MRALDVEFTLCLGIWLTFLASPLVRAVLGRGREQGRRLRAAVGYVIPPLEPKRQIDPSEDVLLRPAMQPEADTLLRMPVTVSGDPSTLLHLEEEAALAEPVTGIQRPPERIVVPKAAGLNRDYIRASVQACCLALSLCVIGLELKYRYVDAPRESLLNAAALGDGPTVADRLDVGASVETADEAGRTLLMLAAQSGSPAMVDFLLREHADVGRRDTDGRTALTYAIMSGDPRLAIRLLDHGARVEDRDHYGVTPLMYAVRPGGAAIVGLLLRRGANARAQDNLGEDALMRSASLDLPAIGRTLLRADANPLSQTRAGTTALMSAAINCPRLIPDLLARGADVSHRAKGGETALFHAASWANRKAIMLLLNAGADPRVADNNGTTPLLAACRPPNGRPEDIPEIVKALLHHGAAANARDVDGTTAVAYLTWLQSPPADAIDALVRTGANLNAPNALGETPPMRAIRFQQRAAVQFLLSRKVDVNRQDNGGETALMCAAATSDAVTVQELLSAGASVTVRDKDNRTALGYAHPDDRAVWDVLRAAGARD